MEELLKQLVTDKGFIGAFWALLADYRRKGDKITQREVYEELNAIYCEKFGEDKFSNFDAFRYARDRKRKKW